MWRLSVTLVFLAVVPIIAQNENYDYDNSLAKICKPVDRPLDVLFILDGSGSVGGSTFEMQLDMLNTVIDLVNVGDNNTQIGVLQYASYTYTEFAFKTHKTKEALRAAITKIRHKSGTTRTGKALDKAYQVFNDENTGSRRRNPNVGQVAIVVSDGHSHDDPIPKAKKLKSAGVTILALGIGPHINMNELIQMTDREDYAFSNLTNKENLNKFTTEFKKLAIGEECRFARGENGADIRCLSNSISIGVSTQKPFGGHLYINGQFYDPKCNVRTNTTEMSLNVGLTDCGIKRQFSVNPRGFLFETRAVIQFHPHYRTPQDETFDIRCFYQDKTREEEANEIDWTLIKEHAQLKTQGKNMPCNYTIESNNHVEETNACESSIQKMSIGEAVTHKWQCNSDNFDTYQSVLVHSCFLMDIRNDVERLLIDEKGCSVDENVIKTPSYTEPLKITSEGRVISHPDGPLIKMRCSLRFCDRLMGECDEILPPKCKSIEKRQAGFAVLRAIGGDSEDQPPQIVTFDHSKVNKSPLSRRRLNLDQSVSASVGTAEPLPVVAPGRSANVRLNTQPVEIVPEGAPLKKVELPTPILPTVKQPLASPTTEAPEYEEYSVEVDDSEEQIKLTKSEQAAIERELLDILPELDNSIIEKMSMTEIRLDSPMISVSATKPDQCNKISR
uniref:VWFA domain-containing protein n=1 Tax=Panagrellus redivivus TaxID=6233 RepID=A0A7E4VPT5_PANRE